MKQEDHYPCFREFYETRYACADNIMHFLVELAYHKKARGFLREDVSNVEIRSFPTTYDSPNDPETVTYTYWAHDLNRNKGIISFIKQTPIIIC